MATQTIYVTDEDLGDAATAADVERYIGILREEMPADANVRFVRGAGHNDVCNPEAAVYDAAIATAVDRAWTRFVG